MKTITNPIKYKAILGIKLEEEKLILIVLQNLKSIVC